MVDTFKEREVGYKKSIIGTTTHTQAKHILLPKPSTYYYCYGLSYFWEALLFIHKKEGPTMQRINFPSNNCLEMHR